MCTLRHDVTRVKDIHSRALFDHSKERSRLVVNFYFFKRSVKKKEYRSFNSRIVKTSIPFDDNDYLHIYIRKFSFKILVYNISNTGE